MQKINLIFAISGILFSFLFGGCNRQPPSVPEIPPSETVPSPTETPIHPKPTDLPDTTTPLPTPTKIPTTATETALPPTKTYRPTLTPVPLPEGVEAVFLKTADGFDLVGFFHTPEHPVAAPLAVLLAHEYYSSHKTLEAFAAQLAEAGFTSLTFDFRGHGESPGFKDFSSVDTDVKAALAYLNRQGFEDVICVGASMGGTGCMAAASADADGQLVGLVNISGPQNLESGVSIDRQELENLDIPKIFMIAQEDTVGPDFVADFIEMAEIAAEPKDVYIYPGQAHASGLLFESYGHEVQEILLNFVKDFAPAEPEMVSIERTPISAADCQAAELPELACTGVSRNDAWKPVVREFNGYEMVLVPAGCFMMGRDEGKAYEQPAHQVCFDKPFWIDRTETIVSKFAQFMTDTKATPDDFGGWLSPWSPVTNELIMNFQLAYQDGIWLPQPGDGERPVETVTIWGASQYCSLQEARLPTEAEWEYAARGPDNWLYPWGDEFKADYVVRIYDKTPLAGSKPQGASWVGALDMSSSLHEWTSTIFQPYPYDPADGRETPLVEDPSSERVLRGGSWYHIDGMNDNLTATGRLRVAPSVAVWPFGFRCVRDFNP